MAKQEDFSISSKSVKHKLNIAFYLMSVLPLLVCMYLVSNYVLPHVGLKLDITLTILLSAAIALTGFLLIKEIFDRLVSVSTEAKLIVAGDLGRKVEVTCKDEIGDLSEALNQLTERIHNDMEQLRGYSDKSTEINIGIHKRVLILSNLLEVSSLISRADILENILKFTVEKSRDLGNSDLAYLFLKDEGADTFSAKAVDGADTDRFSKIKLHPHDKLFGKLIETGHILIIDNANEPSADLKKTISENFKLNSTLALPVRLKDKITGILGIGNKSGSVSYNKDDRELLELFTKQIAIALKNDVLTRQLKELEVRDSLTGLYNEVFIHSRLQEEIKRAIIYRRPCAFALLNIDNFKRYSDKFGTQDSESVLKQVASLISGSVTEIDRVARVGDNEFAVLLPEKNKRQAQDKAENIRKKIESSFSKERSAEARITVSAGISENPLDGVTAEELATKAKDALNFAKREGKNRIGILSQKF